MFLDDAAALVSLPEVCLKLRQTLSDPNHSNRDIAEIIKYDPALTARVLRIVNSAYYGLSNPIDNISHALGILGEEELNNLVIVTSIVKTLGKLDSGLDLKTFWRTSIFCAEFANTLANHSREKLDNTDGFFLGGLLLNVGKLLLYYREPELMSAVESLMKDDDMADFEAEQALLGFDHSVVGAVMADAWNFPAPLITRISEHHGDSSAFDEDGAIIFLSGYISDRINLQEFPAADEDAPKLPDDFVMNKMELTRAELDTLMAKSFEKYVRAYEAFCGS